MNVLIFIILIFPISAMAITHESEISSVAAGGNSNVETYLVKSMHTVQQEKYTYKISGHYTYGEAAESVSARDWDFTAKADRLFTQSWAIYFGEVIEGYRFQDIKGRYNTDAGLKNYFIKSDKRNIFTEFGYRYTVEDRYGSSSTQYENKGRLYGEINDKPSKYFSFRIWFELVPNFTNRKDYIASHEASITSILSSIFSLKVAYRGSYDNQPATASNKNYDYTYTTSLVARF